MATKLVEKGNSVFEVSTRVEGEAWKEAQEKALKKLCEKVEIKGFRKGKAPVELAKDRINPADLINEAINGSLQKAYVDALTENKLQPFTSPEVNVTNVDDNGYDVTFVITVVPEVTLGEYKNIKIALDPVKVSKKDVNLEIDHLLEDNAELVLKEGAAEKGDTVVFDFKGYIDGKEFDGGSADNYSLVLGSNQFIPGFEDQLVGVTSETKKDVLVKFPEQYVKDLAGKDAKFVCMIHEIKTKKKPELTDEFVKELKIENVNTVAELEKYEKKEVETRLLNQAKQKQFSELIETIIKNAKVEIGEKVLDNEVAAMRDETIGKIEGQGLTFEQYKEITGMDDEKLNENFKKDAKIRLEEYLVLNKIAQVENLIITNKEIEDYFEQIANTYGMKVEDVKKTLGNDTNRIASNLLNNKISRFLIANNLENSDEEVKAEPVAEEKAEEKKPAKKPATKKTTKKAKAETTEEAK